MKILLALMMILVFVSSSHVKNKLRLQTSTEAVSTEDLSSEYDKDLYSLA